MLFKKTTISEFVWQRNHNVCVHNLLNKKYKPAAFEQRYQYFEYADMLDIIQKWYSIRCVQCDCTK